MRRLLLRRGSLASAIVVVVALAFLFAHKLGAQPAVQGQWRTLPELMPINPVHMALMNNGKVLIVAGSGNVATNTTFETIVWDPQTDSFFARQTLTWDMFCNGMVNLPDGRVFINGGNLAYDPFKGEKRNAVYDPATNLFTDVQLMAHGRWYPTTTVLGDGRVMTFSGLTETGGTNTAVELYTPGTGPGTGWSAEFSAGWTPPLYPRMHLLTNGLVGYFGSGRGTRTFDPDAHTWSAVIANTNYANTRTYGTSVLLPLSPADGYKSRVMILGGGNPATATTEIIDMSAATRQWQYGPAMSQARIQMNATILPNGKVLATGGSVNDEDAATASLNADLYDPATNTFAPAGSNRYPRLYHSNSLLLPDATVLLAGGNPQRGTVEQHIELYSPAYLFNADGTPAPRPALTGVTPSSVGYGGAFQAQTPDANIASVVLVRLGATTHAFDMEQRLVKLAFTQGSGVLNVTAPPSGVAPPGYYMLFILNAGGVPSFAKFVQLSSSASTNQPPTASITTPATNVTINAGQTVAFEGTGTDDGAITGYSWTFPGGSPSSSSSQSPQATYSTPGSYVASLTVTDNGGLTSAPATRTITVADFTMSAAPSSQTVAPGAGATYTVTVNPGTGFSGDVSFSVSGLPTGATASFNPTTVNTSGSSVLTVTTAAGTPAGSNQLIITGNTGVFTRTVNVTLVVSGTFSLSVSPPSATIKRGGGTNYTVTITGASGPVALSVSGLPKFANSRFNPSSVTGSGTATLTIGTNKNVATGTSTLTITGTMGSTTQSATTSLVINP